MVAAEVDQDQNEITSVAKNLSSCEWYSGIIQFLENLEVPPDITPKQERDLKLKSVEVLHN